jgi:hypothetical protein
MLLDLVKQSTVAYFETLRGVAAIPLERFQSFLDHPHLRTFGEVADD